MTTHQIYNPLFVASVVSFLDSQAAKGPVTRAELCREFSLDEKRKAHVFSDLLNDGLLGDYETCKGPNGGIAKKGAPRPTSSRLDPAFVNLLSATLDKMVPMGSARIVTRGDIAREMGIPSGETEARISYALSEEAIQGFRSKRGTGISRDPDFKPAATEGAEMTSDGEAEVAPAETAPAETAPVAEAPVEPVVEAAPEVVAAPAAPKAGKAKSASKKK